MIGPNSSTLVVSHTKTLYVSVALLCMNSRSHCIASTKPITIRAIASARDSMVTLAMSPIAKIYSTTPTKNQTNAMPTDLATHRLFGIDVFSLYSTNLRYKQLLRQQCTISISMTF